VSGGEAIYSLGTSTRTPSEFLNLLRSFDVEMVVDVRRFPRSRFQHFEREELARLLEAGGFDYVYLGQELGGYRSGGYQSYLGTEEFKQGLERLEQLAKERRLAVVCAERLPWRCHRRFIGWELERDGWQVIHIIDEKRSWRPKIQ
jgi:uncharacterized protein (DUF488 family)